MHCSRCHCVVRISICIRVDTGMTVRRFCRGLGVLLRDSSMNFNDPNMKAACIPCTHNHMF